MRLAVIGTSGSGKSTLAKAVADKFNIPYIEQDALFWRPQWQEVPKDQFIVAVRAEVSADSWTICGNHGPARKEIWARATHIVWLNYPMWLALWRALLRSLRRVFLREECCNGNRETFFHAFMSTNSILWWIWKTHSRRRDQFEMAKASGAFAHVTFLEFKRPHEAADWLRGLHSDYLI